MKKIDPLDTLDCPAQPAPMDLHAPTEVPPPFPSSSSSLFSSRPASGVPPSPDDPLVTRETEKLLTVASEVRIDRATLTVLTGYNAGQTFALDGVEHTIGRGPAADVWLEDPALSRVHARIARIDGGFTIEDLGSTNGTFVGSTRIVARRELASGDRLQLGPNLLLRFSVTDDADEALQRRLYESSTRDALTRVYNRKYFGERIVGEVAHARRHQIPLSLLMLDLDAFKALNDTFGHLAGDMVLRHVAALMQRLVRIEDIVARYGGEEFAILTRSTDLVAAVQLAERVRDAIARTQLAVRDTALAVTASLGVASVTEVPPEGGAADLVALADARLYRAKGLGRNRVCSA